MSGITIERAGYGCYNSTTECTGLVQTLYSGGRRVFLANNSDYGGDPAPGQRKYLYIFWETNDGTYQSGVTGENDGHGINVP